jgi:thiol:disulfide interchange protein DsbC
MKEGCESGECRDCHRLTTEEAGKMLKGAVDNVLAVEESVVGGLWVVDIEKGGRRASVYLDFSKQYLVSGQIIKLSTKENITESRLMRLNKVDTSTIPLKDAIVIGSPEAKRKIIAFSDPDCHFCAKLHGEAKKVVAKTPDVAFFVKIYSRNNDPKTVEKSLSVLCGKKNAPKLLEDAFAGRKLPPPKCATAAVEETARIAARLQIRGTPAMILPDGRIVNGYRDADAIVKLLEENPSETPRK